MLTDEVNYIKVYRKLNTGMFLDALHNHAQTALQELQRKANISVTVNDLDAAKIKTLNASLEKFVSAVEEARFFGNTLNLNGESADNTSLLEPEIATAFKAKVGALATETNNLLAMMQILTSNKKVLPNTSFLNWATTARLQISRLTGDPKAEVILTPPPELLEAKILPFNSSRVKKLSGPQAG